VADGVCVALGVVSLVVGYMGIKKGTTDLDSTNPASVARPHLPHLVGLLWSSEDPRPGTMGGGRTIRRGSVA